MRDRFIVFASLTAWTLTVLGATAVPPTTITANGFGTSVSGAGGVYNITGGFAPGNGSNLFHSFSTFNLGTGDTADFNVSSNTTNIIARVTGGASAIDGTITSTIGPNGPVSSANLFLINPAGIMFTSNAALKLNGAFAASTANYIKFSDGSQFYGDLIHPLNDAGLTSAPVSAFGFIFGSTPQAITFSGTQFTNAGGIHVIGGDITLDQGTTLLAPGGNLTLFSAASAASATSPGEVLFGLASPGAGFASATNLTFGNVTMQNSSRAAIDSAQGGGKIVIRGGHLVVDNSAISSANSSPVATSAGGNISVQANQVNLQDAGQIIASTTAAGDAGNVSVTANALAVDGTNAPPGTSSTSNAGETGIFSNSNGGATGNSGSVGVIVADDLMILNTGYISGSSFSSGKGGDVTVQAASLTIDGTADPNRSTGITSDAFGEGNGGQVDVTVAGQLTVMNSGEIGTDAWSAGNAGDITVEAQSMELEALPTWQTFTGIGSEANPSATGAAGQINVTVADALTMSGQAVSISSSAFSSGNAGGVRVKAGSLSIDDSNAPDANFDTGIYSSSLSSDPTVSAAAGVVKVNVTGLLSLTGGGVIESDTATAGQGGDVDVTAGALMIDGSATPNQFTGISSDSNYGATGDAGLVTVDVTGQATLTGEGRIISNTFSSADAGAISVHAGSLTIDDSARPNDPFFTGILSDSLSSDPSSQGRSGSVTVNVDHALVITGSGDIDTDSQTSGAAGDVTITAGSLMIDGSATPGDFTGISSESDGNATSTAKSGVVMVTVNGPMTMLGNSSIDTDTNTYGNAGDVTIKAVTLTMNGSGVTADVTGITSESNGIDSSTATGGQVTVCVAGALTLLGNTEIDSDTETSGKAGDVSVRAGSLAINGSSATSEFTGISSDALNDNNDAAANNTGNAGDVTVKVSGVLSITGSGEIDGETDTQGKGGDISVTAGSIVLDDAATPSLLDGIVADAYAAGDGGNISLKAANIEILSYATIATSTASSNAGDVTITAGLLMLKNNASIDTTAGNDGGSINLHVGNLLYLYNSLVASAAAGGSSTSGGDITIDPPMLVLDDSVISANDPDGSGGKISILASDFLTEMTPITATGGVSNGEISISAPDLNLSGSLLPLSAALVSEENRLKESCARAISHEYSSLIVVGRGGTESGPDELQADFGVDETSPSATH